MTSMVHDFLWRRNFFFLFHIFNLFYFFLCITSTNSFFFGRYSLLDWSVQEKRKKLHNELGDEGKLYIKWFIESRDTKRVQKEKGYIITFIRSDRGGEFSCEPFESYCEEHGILHNVFAPRTSQQNGVVERKNRTLQEMARTILNENGLPKYF